MKVNVSKPVLGYDGAPVTEPDPKPDNPQNTKEITYLTVLTTALNTTLPEDSQMNAIDKSRCYLLTMRAHQSSEVLFNEEERALIMSRVGKVYVAPLIIGRAAEFFGKGISQSDDSQVQNAAADAQPAN
jgi:hypothetical protein